MEKKSSVWTTKPSKRQAEILEFIAKFQRARSYSPSLAEIAGHFDISIPTVHQHISYLRKKKLLAVLKGKRRSIQPFNDQKRDLVGIPLMGLITAGRGANHYALKVLGTSMIEEGISDGDIIIVREQPIVENGEKAVAYLPDKNAVTLKKIYQEKNRVKLVPANKTMKPFYEKNVEVQGKVIGVLRKYG